MDFFEVWVGGFLLTMGLLTLLWVLSVFLKNASIIDPFWGFGFVVLAFYYAYVSGTTAPRIILLLILVAVWGLRLSIYLLWRNMGHGEDYRYQKFREDYGPERYWWISFFQVFLLQGILMSIIALPLLGSIVENEHTAIGILDLLAVLIWFIGFAFEAGGDFQLVQFKKNPDNKGKVMDHGFWKYTRHPNYFGDSAIWWSFGLFAFLSGSYFTIIGSLIMTLLLLKVSGVSLLEKTLKSTKPQYTEYMKKTNSFFPWFPKKNI